MKLPSTNIQVAIQDKNFDISYPKSGEMIDIAVLKAKLTDTQYSALMYQNSIEAGLAIRLTDAFSFFTVMIPDFKERLSKSLYDLTVLEATELIHAYDNIILPWLNEWSVAINEQMAKLKGDKVVDETDKRNMI